MVDSLLQILKKEGAEQCTLDVVLDASTKAVLQGGLNVLLVSMFVCLDSSIQGYMQLCVHVLLLLRFSVICVFCHFIGRLESHFYQTRLVIIFC